jgi:O-antigen/teichoic acid export membrane protein
MSRSIIARLRFFAGRPARQNAFGSLLIQGSQRLSRLAVIIAAAAWLTPASFAALAVALALTDLVRGTLMAFDVGAVRLLSSGRDVRAVVQASLDAKTLAGFAGLVLATALAVVISAADTVWLIAVSGLGTLATSFAASFLVERQARLALHSATSRVVAASVVGSALALILVWLVRNPVGVVTGLTIGDVLLLALVSAGHGWRPPAWRVALAEAREHGRLMVIQLAHIAQFRVGTIILTALGSTVAVAEYSIASRMTEGLILIAAALTSSSLPLMGAAHTQDDRAGLSSVFDRSYDAGVRAVAPLVAGLVLAAPIWIAILFPLYPSVGAPSAIVGLAVMVFFASSQTTALLNAAHRDRAASWSAVGGLSASVLASISLVSFGAVGVALGRVIGEFVRLLVESAASVRGLEIRPSALVRPWFAVSPILFGAAIAVVGNWDPRYVWVASAVALAGIGMLLFPVLRVASHSR